jgi:hypothetical protein
MGIINFFGKFGDLAERGDRKRPDIQISLIEKRKKAKKATVFTSFFRPKT